MIAALDAAFGALRAAVERSFSERVFLVAFTSNVVLAVFLVFLGRRAGGAGAAQPAATPR